MLKSYLNNFFWLSLTYLSAPCLYFRIFLRRKKDAPLKILIISTAKIGDIVCTTPIFREIKKKFPSCRLAALITNKTKDIVKNNPNLDEIILIDDYSKFRLIKKLRKEKYDWAFNLLLGSFNNIIAFWSLIPNRVATTHKGAGQITKLLSIFNNYRLEYKSHTWLIGHYLNLLKFIGIESASEEKEMFWGEREERKVLDFFNKRNLSSNDLLIGISVTAGNKIKEWQPEKFAALADLFIEKLNAKIIFIGGPKDGASVENIQNLMHGESISAAGFFKLYELPALFKKLRLFLGVDTGPLYIANAAGTPVVNIGGSYNIREQSPSGKNYKILQKYPIGCSFVLPLSISCKEKHRAGLNETEAPEVFEAAVSLINK